MYNDFSFQDTYDGRAIVLPTLSSSSMPRAQQLVEDGQVYDYIKDTEAGGTHSVSRYIFT